jgi:hypothetical protein
METNTQLRNLLVYRHHIEMVPSTIAKPSERTEQQRALLHPLSILFIWWMQDP